jgi:hypothetical protein
VTLVRDGSRSELIRFWHDLVFKLGLITLPVVILSQIVGTDAMVFLFTEQYRHSGYLFQLYVLVLLRYITAFAVLPRAYARTGLILRSNIAALLTMAVTGYLGTVYFGMFGTVAAMLIAQYVHGFIQLQRGRRDIDLPWGQFLPWRNLFRTFVVGILAAVLPMCTALLIHNIIGRLAICIPLYVGCYGLLLYVTKIFDWIHDPAAGRVLSRYIPFVK